MPLTSLTAGRVATTRAQAVASSATGSGNSRKLFDRIGGESQSVGQDETASDFYMIRLGFVAVQVESGGVAVAALRSVVVFIGERANANGSKAFRQLLLDQDWEGMVQLARSQTREGAHVLDVCVDYVGHDGVPDMVEVVDRYATQSTLPLVIDSTETEVIEAALTRLGGRAVINSVNLEDGRNKVDRLLPLARRYGAAVVVLAIDEEGQARTADWKVDVCKRIAAIATGMSPGKR